VADKSLNAPVTTATQWPGKSCESVAGGATGGRAAPKRRRRCVTGGASGADASAIAPNAALPCAQRLVSGALYMRKRFEIKRQHPFAADPASQPTAGRM